MQAQRRRRDFRTADRSVRRIRSGSMKPPRSTIDAPTTPDEAVRLRAELGDEAAILAGRAEPRADAQLAPRPARRADRPQRHRRARVRRRRRRRGCGRGDDPPARASSLRRRRTPDCPCSAGRRSRHVAHAVVRNRGTVGGTIAHADSCRGGPAVLVAPRRHATASSPGGERVIDAWASSSSSTSRPRWSPARCSARCGSRRSRPGADTRSSRWAAGTATTRLPGWPASLAGDGSAAGFHGRRARGRCSSRARPGRAAAAAVRARRRRPRDRRPTDAQLVRVLARRAVASARERASGRGAPRGQCACPSTRDARARGRAAAAALGLPAPRARADGHPRGLRARRLRLLHGAGRRRSARSCLLFAVQATAPRSRPSRACLGRRAAPDPGRVPRVPRAAVRLLHAGLPRGRAGLPRENPATDLTDEEMREGISAATSAAAPAMQPTSSTRPSRPRRGRIVPAGRRDGDHA